MSRRRKSRTSTAQQQQNRPPRLHCRLISTLAPSVASARPVPSAARCPAQGATLAPAAGRGARQPGLVPPQASGERAHGTLRHHGSRQGRQGGRTAIWPSPTPSRPGAGGKLSRLEL
ncbi:unnamed protein product [Urochloa humidicola]